MASVIGHGFQVFTVPPDLLAASESADISSVATPSTQWLFIVTSGGAPKSILTVDQVGGVWTAVSIGGAEMSEALTSLLARWPTSTHSHRFIRSHEAAAEMMEVSQGGRVLGAVPFGSARVTLRRARPLRPERPASDQRSVGDDPARGEGRDGQKAGFGRREAVSGTRRFRRLVVVFALVVATTVFVSALTRILDFPWTNPPQELSQWCWAGTSQAILSYYGTTVSQCTIANYAYGYRGSPAQGRLLRQVVLLVVHRLRQPGGVLQQLELHVGSEFVERAERRLAGHPLALGRGERHGHSLDRRRGCLSRRSLPRSMPGGRSSCAGDGSPAFRPATSSTSTATRMTALTWITGTRGPGGARPARSTPGWWTLRTTSGPTAFGSQRTLRRTSRRSPTTRS